MRLGDWLKQQSLGSAEFARRIGRNHSAVARYLTTRRMPQPDTMARIVAATGGMVGPADFYPHERSSPPAPQPKTRELVGKARRSANLQRPTTPSVTET